MFWSLMRRNSRHLQVGSIRWLLAQPDPRSSFMKLKAGEIAEAASSKYSILSILNEEMPGVYAIRCLRCCSPVSAATGLSLSPRMHRLSTVTST